MSREKNCILAWHFLRDDRRMRDDTPVVVGHTYRVEPPLTICKRGLHASVRALDALHYAPGPIACRVECSGEISYGGDKLVCSERRVLGLADVSRELHLFACDVAESVQPANADPRSLEMIRVKRAWVDGEAGDEELYTAGSTAGSTAGFTASFTARAAARATASSAASFTASFTARVAARAAARATASSAASFTARVAASSTAGSIARAAARAAAWDDAMARFNADLECRLLAKIEETT